MLLYSKTFTPIIDRNGICAAQVRTGAGALVLDGALVSDSAWTTDFYLPKVTIYSAGDLHLVNFIITGYADRYGTTQTETVVGPTAGATVASTLYWHQVTGVATDATIGTNAEVGLNGVGVTPWTRLYVHDDAMVHIKKSGTATVNLQQSLNKTDWYTTEDDISTAAEDGFILTPPTNYARLVCSAYTNGSITLLIQC